MEKFKSEAKKIVELGLLYQSSMVGKLLPEIEQLQKEGYSLERILEAMNEAGFNIKSVGSLKSTIYRLQDKSN